jgi:hypothetical protein
MQHGEMLDDEGNRLARRAWQSASHEAIRYAGELAGLDVHKQLANRVVEPFAWHTAIITATDWGNFWNLRVSPHAQGEFRTCAAMMKELYDVSTPHKLRRDEWHLPLVPELDGEIFARDEVRAALSPEQWLWWAKISAARCARVSYNTHEGKRDIDEDEALFEKLIAPGHMSPLEHTARPMSVDELTLVRAWDISLVNGPTLRVRGEGWANLRIGDEVDLAFDRSRPVKIARIRGPLHYAGKFDGWISLRSMVHGEEDIIGYRASQA